MNPSFAAGKKLRSELYIDTGYGEANQRLFEELQARRTELESVYGGALEFESLPGRRAKRVAVYMDEADVVAIERHEEVLAWFLDAGARFRSALASVGYA